MGTSLQQCAKSREEKEEEKTEENSQFRMKRHAFSLNVRPIQMKMCKAEDKV